MNCSRCGTVLDPNLRFCTRCGTPAPAQTQPAYQPVASAQPKPKRTWLWILLAVLGVLALVCICVAVVLAGGYGYFKLGPGLVGPVASEGTVSEPVDDKGGEVAGPGGAKLFVPEGALLRETEISFGKVINPPPLPTEYMVSAAGPAYVVTVPDGTDLQSVVELLLPLQRQAGADESLYTVFRWDGNRWWDIGGVVEGDFIRTRTDRFSIFMPVYGYQARRPVSFTNHGSYDAVVSVWTFTPRYTDTPAPPPGLSVVSFAPGAPAWPNPSRYMELPLGAYTFCVEYDKTDSGDWWHYISLAVEVVESDPTDVGMAKDVSLQPPDPSEEEGRCPEESPAAAEGGVGTVGTPAPGTGDVTIRLTWPTTDDLDLHVTDPNGVEIYYGNRTPETGGELDRDANVICTNPTTSPVENVYWATGSAPSGTYTVLVDYFSDCDNEPAVQFRLRIMADDRVVYDQSGTLSAEDEQFTYQFTR